MEGSHWGALHSATAQVFRCIEKLFSQTELEIVRKFYMISICIFSYFCHSETFLADKMIHEAAVKPAY